MPPALSPPRVLPERRGERQRWVLVYSRARFRFGDANRDLTREQTTRTKWPALVVGRGNGSCCGLALFEEGDDVPLEGQRALVGGEALHRQAFGIAQEPERERERRIMHTGAGMGAPVGAVSRPTA